MRTLYRRYLFNLGKIRVWEVDGTSIRNHIDPDFTNFGQHYRFKFIPDGEFWIDHERHPGEVGYFCTHLLAEYSLMKNGTSYNEAEAEASRLEKRERTKGTASERPATILKTNSDLVKKKLISEVDGIKIWMVDGELVRRWFPDYTEGGHDLVYKWIPDKEIWIDDDVMPKEIRYTIIHEFSERHLMSQGMPYNRAHSIALQDEWTDRHKDKK